jgi:hypothetical protein
MISKAIQEKLLGIIREKMIPEYKNSETHREKLKEVFEKWVTETYLTERDRELISKYPNLIKTVTSVPIARYYRYGSTSDIDVEIFKGYWTRDETDLSLTYDTPLPVVVDTVCELKEKDKKAWAKIGPHVHRYINTRNTYIKKLNMAYDFLTHKNTTITLIKKEFPELYNLYKAS